MCDELLEKQGIHVRKTDHSIDFPFASDMQGESVKLSLGDGQNANALIIGNAGSGKSTFIHTIINHALIQYSDAELEIWLVDYRWLNTEYKQYLKNEPSLIKRCIGDVKDCNPKEMLCNIYHIMQKRRTTFCLYHAANYSHLKNRHSEDGIEMPRILIIIDSYDTIYHWEQETTREEVDEYKHKLNRLLNEGWSCGIHFLIAGFPLYYSDAILKIPQKVLLSPIDREYARSILDVSVPMEYFVRERKQHTRRGFGVFADGKTTQEINCIRIEQQEANMDFAGSNHPLDGIAVNDSTEQQTCIHRAFGNYYVDVVFCIDNSKYMKADDINQIKRFLSSFPILASDYLKRIQGNNQKPISVRAKVILFNNYKDSNGKTVLIREFFDPFECRDEYNQLIQSIHTVDTHSEKHCDGLEALAYAIRSNWRKEASHFKRRQIVFMISNGITNGLGDNSDCSGYPNYMVKSFTDFQLWWNENADIDCKRLVLVTPNKSWWQYIADTWRNVILAPYNYVQEIIENERKPDQLLQEIMSCIFE